MTLLAEHPSDAPTGYVPPDLAALAAEREQVSADLGARYRVEGFIARGGFSSVWAAFDAVEACPVAVKRIHPKLGSGFFRELRAMFALAHPNVVRIVNFLEAGATRYLILELCAGGSLRTAISAARRGRGSVSADAVVRQIAAGLAEAHKLGLTHRDLKPENVLFADESRTAVKLADFGLARLLAQDDGGALRALTGSPAYMAPEQFCGQYGPASDVYALGVIAFELLTGDVPFVGSPEDLAFHHLRTPPPMPTLSAPWRDLLPAMLAKAPTARPTADAVVSAFAPRTPVLSRSESRPSADIWLAAPGDQIVESGGEFLVAHPNGFTRVGDSRRVFVALPDLVALTPKAGGAWCVAGRAVFEWEPATGLLRLGELPPRAESPLVFEADGRVLAAWLRRDRLTVHDVVADRPVWERSVPCGGLRPKLVAFADGSFAATDFDAGPGLRFVSAGGEDIGRVVLPGICWQLAAWATGGCAARLLTGRGFHAFRASPRGVRSLPGGSGVGAIATDAAGRVAVGAWADGTVKMWEPKAGTRTARVAEGGSVRGAATDGRRAAVLWTSDGGARVTIAE